jgi:hypothetical protein
MPFEILNRAFVFLRCTLAVERTEIFRLPVLGSFLLEYSLYFPDFSFLIMAIPPRGVRTQILPSAPPDMYSQRA